VPFETSAAAPRRIAVIGAGISGMAAAYHLSTSHAVTLFEAEPRLGGHARTVVAGKHGDQPVDTGFIVFNYVNYPHLTKLFADLDVPVVKSDMSFAASIDNGRIEYGLRSPAALFAQKGNLLRPGFLRMLRDLIKFNGAAERLATDSTITLGEFMDDLNGWAVVPRLLPDADFRRDLVDPERGDHGFPRAGAGAVLPQPQPYAGQRTAPVVHGAGRVHRIRLAA
jgi:predicted NAD/FAD-binding protein